MHESREPHQGGDQGTSQRWRRWIAPALGLAALIWFLIRVIPKPSRAGYPCQRAAFPLASAFVLWLVSLAGAVLALRQARLSFAHKAYAAGFACFGAAIATLWFTLGAESPVLGEAQTANEPIGISKGIHPGRVVWVHDREATDWEGPGRGHWWEKNHTNQAAVHGMLSRAVCSLAGENDETDAWGKIFTYHNAQRGKGKVGYRRGEKIVIKVNFVGLIWRESGVDEQSYGLKDWRSDYMNTSPQVIIALLRRLTTTVGADEKDITVCDCLALLANEYYEILHKEFPKAVFVDHTGRAGRVRAEDSKTPFYWSCRPEGRTQDFVPTCFAEAEYVINLANLKAHTGAGVTLCAKNHCGSFVRWPVQEGYFDMHPSLFAEGKGKYRVLVDLMGHSQFGGKTVLYLIDGLYSGKHPIDRFPSKWRSAPFNGDWTSSLFASQDPVAIDSVGLDFLQAEWQDFPHKSGVDDYLHEASLANAPPSGTFYDPDHPTPTTRLASQGVHEHWNNAREKRYSRNLGKDKGIELMAVEVGKR